jgi:L-arabinose isomerase
VLASFVPRDVVDDAVAASGRQELPVLEMPYGQFRPVSGVRDCLNGWLAAGGPHHEVMNLGHPSAAWRDFCQLAGIELHQ